MAISDILFVFPPAPGNVGAFRNHLGAAYLRAALARDGVASSQYLNARPGTIDAVAQDIIRQKCPIVGFTVYDANARLCIALSQSIKRRKPETRIVFGGPTATFNARPLMERHAAIDVCVMGEAEETGAQIFAKLLDGGLDEAQPGVVFRKDGELVGTALPPLVGSAESAVEAALDSTPSPYLSGILTDGRTGVLTSRGCTHHCQYCCFAAIARRRLRLHSIERVVAELEYIAEHQKHKGERYPASLLDDAFTLLPARAKALCRAIADRKLNLDLSCITRADTVDEELMSLMREAGFFRIAFGLESAVPSVLRAAGKVRPPDWPDPDLTPEKQFLERVRNSVRLAKKHGLIVGVSIILGLPSETPADGAETLRFVKELRVDIYTHNFLGILPGTPLWTTHGQYGINCTMDEAGLAETTAYAYDLETLKPGPKCSLEGDAKLVQLLATDALSACHTSLLGVKGTSVVIVQASELSSETAEWLRRVLTVGGIVVQVYPAMKSNKPRLRSYGDDRVLREHLVPAQLHIKVRPRNKHKKSGDDETYEIACAGVDVYRIRKPALFSITTSKNAAPLIAWSKGQDTKATVCEISHYLQQPVELVQLMGRIEKEEAPSPLQDMPIPPQLKYAGRWLRGKAPCSSLSRIEVSSCGEVRCCRHGEPIGKVGDSPKVLRKRLAHLATAVEQRRGCAKCQNTQCPRCPFPGIDDQTYCRVMTSQKPSQKFLDGIHLYSRIPLLLALQQVS